jgi:hypothetical protein
MNRLSTIMNVQLEALVRFSSSVERPELQHSYSLTRRSGRPPNGLGLHDLQQMLVVR